MKKDDVKEIFDECQKEGGVFVVCESDKRKVVIVDYDNYKSRKVAEKRQQRELDMINRDIAYARAEEEIEEIKEEQKKKMLGDPIKYYYELGD